MISTTPSLGVPRYTGAPASGASSSGATVGVLLGTGPPTGPLVGCLGRPGVQLRGYSGVELCVQFESSCCRNCPTEMGATLALTPLGLRKGSPSL